MKGDNLNFDQPIRPVLGRVLSLFFLTFLGLVLMDASLLGSRPAPSGDLAADMLLGNDLIREGYLLQGHYSRWGFNHPGPFWFYWNHLFEVLLQGFNLSRFQIWQWGAVLTSAVLLSFGAGMLSSFFSGKFRLGIALLISALVLGFAGPEVSELWMPWRIVLPYFCFLVMWLWISEGQGWAMPPAAFFCGVLIHGYITMPIFTLPLLAGAIFLGHRKTGFLRHPKSTQQVLLTVGILLVFALPILLDILFQSPSNFSKIVDAQGAMRVSPKPQLQDLWSFFRDTLRFHEAWMMWIGAWVIFVPFVGSGRIPLLDRQRWHRVLGLCAVITVLVMAYYARTPLPLFPFIAQFFIVVPILLFGALTALAFRSLKSSTESSWGTSRLRVVRWIAAGLITGFAALGLERPAPLDSGHSVMAFADAMASHAGERALMLHHEKHDDWPLVAGILLEMERRGYRACATRPEFEVLYTPPHICAVSDFPSFTLVEDSACEGQCLVQGGGRGLRSFSLKSLDLESLTPDRSFFLQAKGQALFRGWSEPEGEVRWSLGKKASLVVLINDPSRFQGTVELVGRSRGPQRIKMSWNGREIFDQRMQLAAEGLKVTFPKDWIQLGYNVLSFELPDAKLPGNGDLRVLALRLKDLRIQ